LTVDDSVVYIDELDRCRGCCHFCSKLKSFIYIDT